MNTITEQDFIQEIQSNPNSNSILIFADFLEESGKGNKSNFLRNAILHPYEPDKFCNFILYTDCLKNMVLESSNLEGNHCVNFAIENAELILPIFEEKYPKDKRPAEIIECAKYSKNTNEMKKVLNSSYLLSHEYSINRNKSIGSIIIAISFAMDSAYSYNFVEKYH